MNSHTCGTGIQVRRAGFKPTSTFGDSDAGVPIRIQRSIFLAGNAGGAFTQRGHVDAQKQHPTRALVSAIRAVGVQGPLGEVTEPLSGLA